MASPQSTDPVRRILSIDALRGIALCGILFVNIFDMGGPVAMDRPLTMPGWSDPEWQVWTVTQLFVTGTMRGLFSLLFGIGLVIFVGEDESADRSKLYMRRLLLLLLFGMIDATLLLWPGDILMIYAFAGVIVLILHRLKPYQLIAAATVILMAISLWGAFDASAILPRETVYSPEMLAREGAARLGSYWQTFDYISYISWSWTVNALAYRWVGDAAAFMLIGIAIYRMGLFASDGDPRWPVRMAAGGYTVGLTLRLSHVALVLGNDGGPTVLSALVEQPGRVAMTLGHLGLFLLLWRHADVRRRLRPIAAMGRMALTLYLGQSLLAAFTFSGFGLGLWNSLSWPQLWLVALAILVIEAVFAALWFRVFRYGPMEWLWRWGTYWRRPTFFV